MQTMTMKQTASDGGVGTLADSCQVAHDGLSLYLHEMGAIALLSHAQTCDLVTRMRAGDEAARHRLIEANLRLVVFVAKRYHASCTASLDLDDLIQAGNLGLMQAVDRYDPARGSFSTYAVWWIRQAMSRTLVDEGRTIRVPAYIHRHLARMARCAFQLVEEQGEEPTSERLAEAMGMSVEQVCFLAQVDVLPESLDRPISGHDERTTLSESIADPCCPDPEAVALEQVHTSERTHAIMAALSCLTEREQVAITLRFGLDGSAGRTLQQVGQCMGISRERARQLQASALAKLRHCTQALALWQTLGGDAAGKERP